MQLQVMNSPFNQEQVELLNQLMPTLTEPQKSWLSGYLTAYQVTGTGIVQKTQQSVETPALATTEQPIAKEVTILYGSQTGNAHGLATKVGKTFDERGFQVTISSMSDFKPNNLKKVQNLLLVVSTNGEGEPPDNALSFHEFLHGRRAPKLENFHFSVLALGDSSYELFCQTGKDFDQQLEKLGGTRLYPRVDCDVEYDEPAANWLEGVLSNLHTKDSEQTTAITQVATAQATQVEGTVYSRKNPFKAEVLENINLNGRGSNKETRHLELSLEGSGLTFEPGDSVGVYPENDPALVDQLLAALPWAPDEKVTVNKEGDVLSLKEALLSYFEITVVTKPLLKQIAPLLDNEKVNELLALGHEDDVKAYVKGRDLLDVIQDFGPWGESAQVFVSILRKIPVRLYSIASSLAANPDEVHLTIGAVRYDTHGRERKGVCSILCAERLQPGDTLPVYIQPNKNFNLPENPETPIIMVGPGTGIAPFRSFIQEREEIGAQGKSWLFFGDQYFVTDFLYQTEWQKLLADGVLTKLDLAFSRDTEEKVYVQNRMLEHSQELFEWLEQGAAFYVCGDKDNMAKDVQNTLLDIIEKEGKMNREQAEQYLADLKKQKRYQRDVY